MVDVAEQPPYHLDLLPVLRSNKAGINLVLDTAREGLVELEGARNAGLK